MAAPASGSQAKWSDITSLFTELNTVRQKWKYSTVSVPSGGVGTKINQNILPKLYLVFKNKIQYYELVNK